MSLIVTPIRSMTAYCISGNRFDLTREFGPLWYWVYTRGTVDSSTGVVFSEVAGFIRTKRSSIIPGTHDCDNLQLSGTVDDVSLLGNWYNLPVADQFPGYAGIPYVTWLRNVAGGVSDLTPAPIMVQAGTDSYTPYTPASEWNKKLWIVVTMSLELFGHIIGGYFENPSRIGGPNDYLTFAAFKVSQGGGRLQSSATIISMTGRAYSRETLDNYVVPAARSYLKTAYWDPYQFMVPKRYSSTATVPDPNAFRDSYNSRSAEWLTIVEKQTNVSCSFGELHYRALCKVDGFSGNGFAYLRDVKNILSELKNLFALLKGNVTPKSLSSLYLTWRYGLRLTAADTSELTQALKRASAYASGVSATETVTIGVHQVKQVSTIRYKKHDDVFDKIYHFFRYLDLLPSADNIWDLIPYSFVLDWFVNVGSIADQTDKLDLIRHLTINAVYDSSKLSYTGPASLVEPNLIGQLTATRYKRVCHNDASFPLIVPQSRSTIAHWVDGLALIIQRLK